MPTPHNEANINDIAKTVIMPGDPLRAKYIAENFLENYKLVNQVRGMYAYAGTYNKKRITIMASGMGMPSMGIYAYELYKFYNVENIIRIGSCGSYMPNLKLFDIILTNKVFSESNFALTLNNDNCHIIESDKDLNSVIEKTADITNINRQVLTLQNWDNNLKAGINLSKIHNYSQSTNFNISGYITDVNSTDKTITLNASGGLIKNTGLIYGYMCHPDDYNYWKGTEIQSLIDKYNS